MNTDPGGDPRGYHCGNCGYSPLIRTLTQNDILLAGVVGAAVGAAFGPIGAAIGGLAGLFVGSRRTQPK